MTDYAAALRQLSEPWPSGDKMKAAVARAADLAGLPYWRAFNIWYGKARRIEAFEADQIREALQRKTEQEDANELHDLRTRLLKMESRLAAEGKNVGRTPAYSAGRLVR